MLNIKQDILVSELNKVSGVVDRKHTLPILSNVLVQVRDGELKIVGSNLDIQLTTKATLEDIDPSNNIEFAADCKNLIDLLKILPSGVSVQLTQEQDKLQLVHTSGVRNLNTHVVQDFPIASVKPEKIANFVISEKNLKEALKKTAFSMATQDIRYYLNGMLILVEEGQLELVTTDGHRLSYTKTDLVRSDNSVKTIIPRKTILELQKLLRDTDDEVEVDITENQAVFKFSNLELVTKLIEGKFPDYTRVIPSNNPIHINLKRHTLQSALLGVSVLMSDKFKGVKVILKPSKMVLSSTNEKKEYSEEELDIDYQGEEFDIGFNVNYLLDLLSHTQGDDIRISFADTNSSALFTVHGDVQYKYVVMPMRI